MQMIINGEKCEARSGRTIDTINPATGEVIDTIPAGGAVFSENMNRAFDVAARVETGMISINGGNLYRPDLSAFGGYKKSGNSREGFHYTLEEMTQIKNIVLRGVMPT